MIPKLIKDRGDYEAALAEIRRLVVNDPPADSVDGERLELLAHLVGVFERETFPLPTPTPLAAILFRMEQQELTQRDLVPYLGSRSRVSEVLSGKRSLTLAMIRTLSHALDIPTDVLLAPMPDEAESGLKLVNYPISEMIARGWLPAPPTGKRVDIEELARYFLGQLGSNFTPAPAFRRTIRVRGRMPQRQASLHAWSLQLALEARKHSTRMNFDFATLPTLIREVLQLSPFEKGPRLAIEHLASKGLCVVVEPHLRGTRLDGAALLDTDDRPVVGLTLRHDRVNYFWFTLVHELVHVLRHLRVDPETIFVDDLDQSSTEDQRETEADLVARDFLIPPASWARSAASTSGTPESVIELANELRISPAIVAGRIRHERRNFRILSSLVGYGNVRRHFPEVSWHAK